MRYVHPENVYLNYPFCLQITDFGLAKIRATTTSTGNNNSRSTAHAAGSVGYIPPERYESVHLDMTALAKSDIYRYTLYWLCTWTIEFQYSYVQFWCHSISIQRAHPTIWRSTFLLTFELLIKPFTCRLLCIEEDNAHVITENVKGGTPFKIPIKPCPHGYDDLMRSCCSRNVKDRPPFTGTPQRLHVFAS